MEESNMEKELSFEDKMKRLDEIVEEVENSTLALEKSLALYEEGIKLIKELQSTLDDAENKIKEHTINA